METYEHEGKRVTVPESDNRELLDKAKLLAHLRAEYYRTHSDDWLTLIALIKDGDFDA